MAPVSVEPFDATRLVSRRARLRHFEHFSSTDLSQAPAGFTPHPDPLSLNVGRPNPQYFPVRSLTVEVDEYPFHDTIFAGENGGVDSFTVGRDDAKGLNISKALQYGPVKGHEPLRQFVTEFVAKVTAPGYAEWEVTATNGLGDGLSKAADAILDEGDVVLLEEFTFSPFKNTAANVGAVVVPTKLDLDKGDLDVDYLEKLLENWDELQPHLKGRKPKAFYTIPTAQNPTGITQSADTRQRVVELARIHDFVIIEDDPYGYLTLPPYQKPDAATLSQQAVGAAEFLRTKVPLYAHFDTEGRVVRLETFSKIFAPGLRLGFIVAHKSIVAAIQQFASVGVRAPSGVSQLLLANVIDHLFKDVDGLLGWITKVRLAYAHRRNVVLHEIYESEAYAKGHLRIISSNAGMFGAIGINFPKADSYIDQINQLNFKFLEHGVGVVLGYKMAADAAFSAGKADFIRISFAPLDTDAQLAEALRRLAAAVLDYFS